ncbi:unnamed protein product [Cuscuta campestris]|uniref:Uncharacterized protein n=1 Tax=Cuscuta campestris TaxID=132261 RepID=A0A484L2R7_9ASTE|nr:unnamed protein product [Cuscuta campestris]
MFVNALKVCTFKEMVLLWQGAVPWDAQGVSGRVVVVGCRLCLPPFSSGNMESNSCLNPLAMVERIVRSI